MVATLGKLPGLDEDERAGWEEIARLLDGTPRPPLQGDLFVSPPASPRWTQVALTGVRVERVREFGQVYLALALWRRLGLHQFFAEHGREGRERIDWASVAAILTIGRFCDQASELALSERWYARTALDDLLGVSPGAVHDYRLYRGLDEMLPLLRQLWSGVPVSHHGRCGDFEEVRLAPLPVQQPLEFWTGGMVPAALRRCGRFADGWLPSACTPDEVAAARVVTAEAAAEAGRAISPEHFGVSIAYADAPLGPGAVRALGANRRGVDPSRVVPVGIAGLRAMLEQFVAVGFSKFVVRPLAEPASWRDELEALAAGVLDLQT